MEIEDADLAGVDDGADRLEARAVQVLLVLAVLDEAVRRDVGLERRTRHEVVVLAVVLRVLAAPARVCSRTRHNAAADTHTRA